MKFNKDSMLDMIESLLNEGYSIEGIGHELQIPESTVRRHYSVINSVQEKENSDAHLDTNYVKLSLDKYEEMKNKIAQKGTDISYLESEVRRLTGVITKLGIPVKIIDRVGIDIPLSCYWKEDFNIDPSKLKRKYCIEFEVEARDLIE